MKILTLDFEAQDPYIKRGLGAGWPYKLNVPNSDFKLLCAGLRYPNRTYGMLDFVHNPEGARNELMAAVGDADAILCHNATYDIGCLLTLGIGVKDKLIIDTLILSKLYRNNLMSHSLDKLSQRYLKEKKGQGSLVEEVWAHDIYPYTKRDLAKKQQAEKLGIAWSRKRPIDAKLESYAYEHLDEVYARAQDTVERYCQLDVELTWKLYVYFSEQKVYKDLDYWSDLLKATLKMRAKGVRIDLNQARKVHMQMVPVIAQAYSAVYKLAGEEFNLASPKDVPRVLTKLGITCPKTDSGRDSATSDWLANIDHPIGEAISKARKLNKLDKDFIQSIIELQKWTMGVDDPHSIAFGRLYPELKLFGAATTSRFSCASPNVQQIPSKDEEYAPLVRSIFVAEEGEKWASLDWMNQEGRIQVHFAQKYKCAKAEEMILAYHKNPRLDMHQTVADMVGGIDRKLAKIINLGLPYGMGMGKLIKSLGRGQREGKEILDAYFRKAPFLKELMQKTAEEIKAKGYIETIDGVKLWKDETRYDNGNEQDFSYKAINYISQGSAAAQARIALVQAYREGLPVTMVIHDEFNLSIQSIEQAEDMKDIMESCYNFLVPFVADLLIGNSWAVKFEEKTIGNNN
jgi:DNA polymerase I-like protein with 3'-5' exonuclease and polymerase domains